MDEIVIYNNSNNSHNKTIEKYSGQLDYNYSESMISKLSSKVANVPEDKRTYKDNGNHNSSLNNNSSYLK